MYSITVETEFCAAHALEIAGRREALHGHNFRVWAVIRGKTLDSDGLLCDFHTVHDALLDITDPFQNANLHDTPAFRNLNPTAEHMARHIGEALRERLDEALAPHARVSEVRVSEAPGCVAAWHGDQEPEGTGKAGRR